MGFSEPTDSSDEERLDFSITENDLLEEADNFYGDSSNRRTRRKFTKNDAIYGIWAEEDEDEGKEGEYSKYSANMSFVKADSSETSSEEEEFNKDETEPGFTNGATSADETNVNGVNSSDMEVDRPSFGGLGYRQPSPNDNEPNHGHGLGFKGKERMKLDDQPQAPTRPSISQASSGYSTPMDSPRTLEEMKSLQFGKTTSSSFKQTGSSSASSSTVSEKKFKAYGFGFEMLQKMGYKAGEGLGLRKDGIAEPIETKLRPGRIGIAYKGFAEKTEQVRKQEKRHSSAVDTDEALTPEAENRARGQKVKREKRPPRTKTKYQSIEEIMVKVDAAYNGSSQKIIDMRGPEVRELASASELGPGSVEIKDDIRLIVDLSRGELDHLARERRIEEHRLKSFQMERKRFQSIVDEDDMRITRLNEIIAIAKECEKHMKTAMVDGSVSLEIYEEAFSRLEYEFRDELNSYPIDSLCVAVCSPMLKRLMGSWYPLEDPTYQLTFLRKWKNLFKVANPSDTDGYDSDVDMYMAKKDEMKPYESMLYHLWLPRVRSAVVNDWNPREFDAMVTLLENWTPPILPQFIYDNVVDQLIIPKLMREIEQWDPRKDTEMIHHWLHPWLPLLGDRLEALYTAIRHKFIIVLREWHPSEVGAHALLKPWVYVFREEDFRTLLSKAILPKLKQTLRAEFVVNPRQQDLQPLEWVLRWKDLILPEKLAQLLEKEFFPKWLHVLKAWLASKPNYDEVTQWYLFWKKLLVSELKEEPLLMSQFRIALDLMNQGVSN